MLMILSPIAMKATIIKTRKMAQEYSNGQVETFTQAITKMMKEKDLEK